MWKLAIKRTKKALCVIAVVVLCFFTILYSSRIVKKTEHLDFISEMDSISLIRFRYQGEDIPFLELEDKEEIEEFLQYLSDLKFVREDRRIYCEIRKPIYCYICGEHDRLIYLIDFEREYTSTFEGYYESTHKGYALKYHIPFCKHPIEKKIEEMILLQNKS